MSQLPQEPVDSGSTARGEKRKAKDLNPLTGDEEDAGMLLLQLRGSSPADGTAQSENNLEGEDAAATAAAAAPEDKSVKDEKPKSFAEILASRPKVRRKYLKDDRQRRSSAKSTGLSISRICARYGKTPTEARVAVKDRCKANITRKTLYSLDMGFVDSEACFQPNEDEKEPMVLFPRGWTAAFVVDGQAWVGKIEYVMQNGDGAPPMRLYIVTPLDENGMEQHQFRSAHPTATRAYVGALELAGKHTNGSYRPNGKLFFGISYPSVQEHMRMHFRSLKVLPCAEEAEVSFRDWMATHGSQYKALAAGVAAQLSGIGVVAPSIRVSVPIMDHSLLKNGSKAVIAGSCSALSMEQGSSATRSVIQPSNESTYVSKPATKKPSDPKFMLNSEKAPLPLAVRTLELKSCFVKHALAICKTSVDEMRTDDKHSKNNKAETPTGVEGVGTIVPPNLLISQHEQLELQNMNSLLDTLLNFSRKFAKSSELESSKLDADALDELFNLTKISSLNHEFAEDAIQASNIQPDHRVTLNSVLDFLANHDEQVYSKLINFDAKEHLNTLLEIVEESRKADGVSEAISSCLAKHQQLLLKRG